MVVAACGCEGRGPGGVFGMCACVCAGLSLLVWRAAEQHTLRARWLDCRGVFCVLNKGFRRAQCVCVVIYV